MLFPGHIKPHQKKDASLLLHEKVNSSKTQPFVRYGFMAYSESERKALFSMTVIWHA